MKIAHITTVHRVFDNRIFYKQCGSLVEAGYDVHLIACHHKAETVNGVHVIPVGPSHPRVLRMSITCIAAIYKAIVLRARVVQIHDPELLPYAFLLMLLGRKVVFDMHENIDKDFSTKAWLSRFNAPLAKVLWKTTKSLILKRITVVFAEDSYKLDYPELAPGTVIHNYPKLNAFKQHRNRPKRNRFTIVYFGSISEYRGIETTINAIKLLNERGIFIDFLCIGPLSDHLKSRFEKASEGTYPNQIKFCGYLPFADGLQMVAECHLGIALLDRIPNLEHSLPTKLFEYLALGLPAITSNFDAYRKIIDGAQGGMCIEPGNPHVLADAINSYYENPELLERQGETGCQYVCKNYSWEKEASLLVDLYREIERKVLEKK